jgi:sulfite exporter TauE/SafE
MSVPQFLGLIAIIAALYLIIRSTVGFDFIPSVGPSMGYGLVFVVGLITSLHCVAMCGGIALSQTISRDPASGNRLLPALLYNGGRLISYTAIGGAAGALGSVFALSTALKGLMPIIAGIFMLFLGVRMLGVFPRLSRLRIRLPFNRNPAPSRRGPFIVGLLNGFMPCGPLQTMQVYALGTGSFFAGAFSLFLFGLGTVPLMLGFGIASALLSARFNARMLKASGVLVAALGLAMFGRGLNLYGVGIGAPSVTSEVARIRDGVQTVETRMESGRYYPLIVQKGVPVHWTVSAKSYELNGCNNPLTVPQYGIRKRLVPGDNLIEFTPTREGIIAYTCWMGMVSSTITVVTDVSKISAGAR